MRAWLKEIGKTNVLKKDFLKKNLTQIVIGAQRRCHLILLEGVKESFKEGWHPGSVLK